MVLYERSLPLAALALALAISQNARAQHSDPLVGLWTMDMAKSEWGSALPVPYRAFIVHITTDDLGYRVRSDVVYADGREVHSSNLWRYDGAEAPWQAGASPPGSTAQFQRINDTTYQFVLRTNGIIRLISRGTLAADGRSRRHIVIGFDAKGQAFRNVEVYRKQ